MMLHASGLMLPWSGSAQGLLDRLWGEAVPGEPRGGPGLALALHLTLPLGLLALGWLHVRLARRAAADAPGEGTPREPAWPQGITRLILLLGAGLAIWLGMALLAPNLLLLPDQASGSDLISPGPWYLWAPAGLGRALPRGLGLVLTALLGCTLLFWPWWDSGHRRRLLRRPLAAKVAVAAFLLWLLLTLAGWWGGQP
jgi:quinol-cytochrome oxidoreductase complex cytochrome b subunit